MNILTAVQDETEQDDPEEGHQPRERAVMCLCGRMTWRFDAKCEVCRDK